VLHDGRFYKFRGDLGPGNPEVNPTPVLPRPVQQPRIPIWVAASWPRKAPTRRAALWDGIVPLPAGSDFAAYLTAEDTRAIAEYIAQHRDSDAPYDIAISGHTASAADNTRVKEVADAGATWWTEDMSPWPFGWNWEGAWPLEAMLDRIRGGPARV
jgi:alkanesulfonate monooxygenase SsuD/methylene tetrahydromethanopterin reductase-like flavin-dependent oxidoreductase (luciferase family)